MARRAHVALVGLALLVPLLAGCKAKARRARGPAAPAVAAEVGDWEMLGERHVDFRAERDTIVVTRLEGTFRRIQLRVKQVGVEFLDLKVHYGNGDVQDVGLRAWIPAGGETRVIDLPGAARVIKKVVFTYRTRGARPGKALVRLWGKH